MGLSVRFCLWRDVHFVGGGSMLGLTRLWVLFGGSFAGVFCGSNVFRRRILLGGLGDAEGYWGCVLAGVWVMVRGRFRVMSVDVGVGLSCLLLVYVVVCFVCNLVDLCIILRGL